MNVRILSRQVEEAIGYEIVFFKGRNDGESLFANTAVISFYDPPDRRGLLEEYKPVDYSAVTKRLFQIALHDIDIEVLEEFNLDFKSYLQKRMNWRNLFIMQKMMGSISSANVNTGKVAVPVVRQRYASIFMVMV